MAPTPTTPPAPPAAPPPAAAKAPAFVLSAKGKPLAPGAAPAANETYHVQPVAGQTVDAPAVIAELRAKYPLAAFVFLAVPAAAKAKGGGDGK